MQENARIKFRVIPNLRKHVVQNSQYVSNKGMDNLTVNKYALLA